MTWVRPLLARPLSQARALVLFAALLVSSAPLFAQAPPVTATQTDTISPARPDGYARQGDGITYTTTITAGSANATGVTFTEADPAPANTSPVANSLRVSPIAVDDAYPSVLGNTQLFVPPRTVCSPTISIRTIPAPSRTDG